MKRTLAIIVVVIGILLAAIGIHWKSKAAVAVSIIGGADGPTSIFLAGKIGDGFILSTILIGIVLVVAGVIIYKKIKKEKSNYSSK